MTTLEVVTTGLGFTEGPRWHDGRLWCSDMMGEKILAIDVESGRVDEVVHVPGRPSGLGWDGAGRLHVVSMLDRQLLREDAPGSRELTTHADLSTFEPCQSNDMIVDRSGRAYVGGFGFDLLARQPFATASIALIHGDGRTEVAAEDLRFPNGMAVIDDGRTLVVAESLGARLTAFTIDAAGRLDDRRAHVVFDPEVLPDGICADADGSIWVASPATFEVVLVRGGAIVDRISTGRRRAMACALGGADGRSLFLCTARHGDPIRDAAGLTGELAVVRVATPAAAAPRTPVARA